VIERWILFTALTLASMVVAGSAAAQDTIVPDTGAPSQGQIKFNISVLNQTGQAIRFLLRPKAATWTEYTLSPGEKGVYSCTGCGGTFEISLSTGGTVVTYDIATGNLYAIRLNDTRNIFDVYHVQ
jgi:hypothetical protein